MTSPITQHDFLAPEDTLPLLEHLPSLGPVTCIVLHGGCVFEFSGEFPRGQRSEGHLNLMNNGSGFHGHLALAKLHRVRFQDKPHRGRPSYAFVFEDPQAQCLFKVFLGRDAQGEVLAHQLAFFQLLQIQGSLIAQEEKEL
ncbi:ChuX/HutX family heme-like substrate-binding protein [Congregibacter litoralis]|uniref:Putative heme iron utilization protein n=1 Tax=Congregibacter litoralis KT71 TaxID=314285 RepID=A4A516_9GAMM|nr:ChuX/HutX family heme-like substrate-binding protein [Congregibacter litoralis]EAQ98887.1 putative heme iron utilization protein [Congregibacter litoralis KT71]